MPRAFPLHVAKTETAHHADIIKHVVLIGFRVQRKWRLPEWLLGLGKNAPVRDNVVRQV